MSARGNAAPFGTRAIAIIVALLLAGAAGYLLLNAYGDALRPQRDGGGHALSTSAVGYSGLVELIRLSGGQTGLVRSESEQRHDGLLVLTPPPGTKAKDVKAILERRTDLPTLVILPKWFVRPLRQNRAWVEATGTLPAFVSLAPVEGITQVTMREDGDGIRSIDGPDLSSAEDGSHGGILLAEIDKSQRFLLADPDVLDNQALATPEGAARAMRLLRMLAPATEPIDFDVTLAGFGRNPNLLKLTFEAPFLPLTLCLLFAAALAVLHALRRFGPPAREERAVAFGKAGLAENAAALLRLARRRHRTGGRYAALTREAVAAATGAPAGMSAEALDAYLDRLNREGEPFSQIAARAADAPDTRRLLAAARDLYHWKRTVTRDHR